LHQAYLDLVGKYQWDDYVWFTNPSSSTCINVKKHTFILPMHDAFITLYYWTSSESEM